MAQATTLELVREPVSPKNLGPQQLETLLQMVRSIGPILDLAALIDRVGRQLAPAFKADAALLFLHAPQREQLWTLIRRSPESWPQRVVVDENEGLCGHVFQCCQPLLISDLSHNAQFSHGSPPSPLGPAPQSVMAVPVAYRPDHCAGVLQVNHRDCDVFDESDLALLATIAEPVAIAVENAQRYEAERRQFDTTVGALTTALDARDAVTAHHSLNVANYAMGIGAILGLDAKNLEWLRLAGLLHNVGKIGTPDRVLNKAGWLDPEEYEVVKKHARYTRKILEQIAFAPRYDDMAYLAAAHHEKLDGSGYPDGLAGNLVPLKARILCVADIFHALTQPRPHRPGMPLNSAISVLDDLVPDQIDARCVSALKVFLGIGQLPKPAA